MYFPIYFCGDLKVVSEAIHHSYSRNKYVFLFRFGCMKVQLELLPQEFKEDLIQGSSVVILIFRAV